MIVALDAKTGEPCRDTMIDKVAATPEALLALLGAPVSVEVAA